MEITLESGGHQPRFLGEIFVARTSFLPSAAALRALVCHLHGLQLMVSAFGFSNASTAIWQPTGDCEFVPPMTKSRAMLRRSRES
jgi:hypothetical protein